MSDYKLQVESHLKKLTTHKSQCLIDLIYDLGYEYDNEHYDPIFSNWTPAQKALKNQIVRLGYHGDFSIFWVRLTQEIPNKTAERTIINLINRRFPYNLFVFSNRNDTIWDFVNIKAVKDEASEDDKEPKKRQYLRRIRIDGQENLHTAIERLSLLKVPAGGLHHFDLQKRHDEAFDVEKVTDAFFKDFQKIFANLRNKLTLQTNDKQWAHAYTLQFMNRLMFLYFIQKKRWLNNDPFFMKSYWWAYQNANQPVDSFVGKWLSVLFFEAFNKPYSHPQWIPKEYQKALQMAPYLNGGLFKRNELDNQYSILIKDADFRIIIDFLEKYNFTIAEDSPIEQEVAVDPEMIGKVFESLVNVSDEIDERGEAGIFYTPRTEITLMCRLALVDRLANEFGENLKPIFYEMLFAFQEEDKTKADERIADENLWPGISRFLREITIVDPAVGSGSFLVGMLSILTDLTKRANKQTGEHERDYDIKKRIIGQSLYGVDVMDWAVHVCELRLWLQLIIETELKPEELTLEPLLPNLTFKIRVGDSLVQEVGGINMTHLKFSQISRTLKGRITTLKGEKRKYFDNDPQRKFKYERQIVNEELRLFKAILDEQILNYKNRLIQIQQIIQTKGEQKSLFISTSHPTNIFSESFDKEVREINRELERLNAARNALKGKENIPFVWEIAFAEIFEGEQRGFDIVLGNPPYVRQEKISDPHKNAEDYGGENRTTWRMAKKKYKEKLARSIYQIPAYNEFFQYKPSVNKALRKLDAKNDLYVYFYLYGLSLLNTKGSFCFVTSNSWLDVGYGKDLQEFLLKKVPVKLILDNQVKRTFRSADVNTVICLFGSPVDKMARKKATAWLEKSRIKFVMFYTPFEQILDPVIFEEIEEATDRKTRVEFRVVPMSVAELMDSGTDKKKKGSLVSYTGDKWGGKYLRAPDIYFTILEKAKDKLVRLGDIAEVRFGIKTGANEFFYLTREKIDEWGIEEEYLKPVIKSPRECKTIQIDPSTLKYKIFMCHRNKDELKGTNALKYIEWGESKGFHLRPSCAGRKKWWDLGRRRKPDGVFTCGIGDIFRTFKNNNVLVDKRLYELFYDDENWILPYLNSTLYFLFLELGSRTGLGDGLMDLTVYEVENILVIDKVNFRKGIYPGRIINDIYSECGFDKTLPIRKQEPNPLPDRKALDDIVFDAIGLTEEERKEVYWAVCELVQQRLEKAKSV